MYHAVLYLRISILHSIVYSFRRSVGVPEREAAIHSDFQINIYPVSKQAGVYLVYTQHMPLFQRCIGNDLNSVFRTGAVHHLLTESRKMETAAFTMNRQIATEANGVKNGKSRRAPRIPRSFHGREGHRNGDARRQPSVPGLNLSSSPTGIPIHGFP